VAMFSYKLFQMGLAADGIAQPQTVESFTVEPGHMNSS